MSDLFYAVKSYRSQAAIIESCSEEFFQSNEYFDMWSIVFHGGIDHMDIPLLNHNDKGRYHTNIVELVSDGEDCAFDQPCAFGHRIESHAVYCHNTKWENAPRKCRKTWYTGGETRDEDCPGFKLNEKNDG